MAISLSWSRNGISIYDQLWLSYDVLSDGDLSDDKLSDRKLLGGELSDDEKNIQLNFFFLIDEILDIAPVIFT